MSYMSDLDISVHEGIERGDRYVSSRTYDRHAVYDVMTNEFVRDAAGTVMRYNADKVEDVVAEMNRWAEAETERLAEEYADSRHGPDF